MNSEIVQEIKKIPMPTFNATLVSGGLTDPRVGLPISDHSIVVADTAVGVIVNLNIWCPGSSISPSKNTKGHENKKFHVEDTGIQKDQMIKMAKYLFDMAKAGAAGFMLQEVPQSTDPNFGILNNELKRLCNEHNAIQANEKIYLQFQCQHNTEKTRSSTCVLLNTEKLNIVDKTPTLDNKDPMYHRFGCYEINRKDDGKVKCNIYNIHGDYTKQDDVKKFIEDNIKKGNIVCGDFNLENKNKPDINLASSYKQDVLCGNTLDGFYDPFTQLQLGQTNQPDKNSINPTSQPPKNTKANQTGTKPIPSAQVKPFLEGLFTKQGLQFKAETDPANPAAIKYRVQAAPGAQFVVQADKDGKLSLSADNEAVLVKMIELLAAKIKENGDSPFVVLGGDAKAMKIMKDACKRMGLEAVPKDYKIPDQNKPNQTKLTLEDEDKNHEKENQSLRIRGSGGK